MPKYHCIYYYYIKNLHPDYQRHIMGEMKDLVNSYDDKAVLDTDNFAKKWDLNLKQMNYFLECIYWKYENINRYLLKHQIKPFFNTKNLKECIKIRDEYLEFISEEECMKKYGVCEMETYIPPKYPNDLTTVIELYTDNKYIIAALQCSKPKKVNVVAGLANYNGYKFINWMLMYEGLEPLFLDVEDEEECEKRRKELLQLLPFDECLKYWNIEKKEEIIKYKRPKMSFLIEKYIDCWGTNAFNTPYRYEVGWRLYSIINPQTKKEDVIRYIKEINNITNTPLFLNPMDIGECIKFIKDNLILVEIE